MIKNYVQVSKNVYVVSDNKGELEVINKEGKDISLKDIYLKISEVNTTLKQLKKAKNEFRNINLKEKNRFYGNILSFIIIPIITLLISLSASFSIPLTICSTIIPALISKIFCLKFGLKKDNVKKINRAYDKKLSYEEIAKILKNDLKEMKKNTNFKDLTLKEKKQVKPVENNEIILDSPIILKKEYK